MAELDGLLEPISDASPGGEDVFYGDEFAELTALREQRDTSAERKWTPDWDGVAEVAQRILEEQSKDIRVALYLAEALLNTEGFRGFHSGLALVQQILERFPEEAHPREPDDRAYALDFLVGALQADSRQVPEVIRAVELAPLTDWGHHVGHYLTWKKEGAGKEPTGGKAAGAKGKEKEEAAEDTAVNAANFGKGFIETGKAYYKELHASVPKCVAAIGALEAWGKAYFEGKVDPRDTPIPRYTRILGELKKVQDATADLLARKLVDDPDPVGVVPEVAASGEAPGASAGAAVSPVAGVSVSAEPRDTADAASRVVAAARFLRSQAPTDPAPYMLIRGLRWGELRTGGAMNMHLLEPPDTALRKKLYTLLLDQSWDALLEAGEAVMGEPCGRGWLDLQRYIVTALDNLGPEYQVVSRAVKGQLASLLADVPELVDSNTTDDMPTANAQTKEWLALAGLLTGRKAAGDGDGAAAPDYDKERLLSEATHERALAMVASGNARAGVEMLMKRADREESARARFITESLAASVMVDAGMAAVAKPMLEDLEKLIESRKLGEWESAEVVARPLGLLYRCLPANDRKRTELYDKICRLDPVHAMGLDGAGRQGPSTVGQPVQASQPSSSTRGQPFQPNDSTKSSQQGEAVGSGSSDPDQGAGS